MSSKLPQPISKEEFDKLLAQAKKDREEYWMPRKEVYKTLGKNIQEYIIAMILAYGSGMRISEIVGLEKKYYYKSVKRNEFGEIMRDQNKKPISEKRLQTCSIPKLMPDKVGKDFISIIGAKGGKDRSVIIPFPLFRKAGIAREEFLNSLPLETSRSSIQRYVTELGKKVLNKNISIHKFRHGFGTYMLNQGMNIKQVQMLLGHSNLATTNLYLHASPEEALAKVKEMQW